MKTTFVFTRVPELSVDRKAYRSTERQPESKLLQSSEQSVDRSGRIGRPIHWREVNPKDIWTIGRPLRSFGRPIDTEIFQLHKTTQISLGVKIYNKNILTKTQPSRQSSGLYPRARTCGSRNRRTNHEESSREQINLNTDFPEPNGPKSRI